MEYKPAPIDTSDIVLNDDLLSLSDLIAKNVHDVWALGRQKKDGFTEKLKIQLKKPLLVWFHMRNYQILKKSMTSTQH